MTGASAGYARLREILDGLPPLPGVGRVEIAEGTIRLTLPPVNRHELAVLRITRRLNARLPSTHPGYVAHPGADLEDVGLGRLRCPDLMTFTEEALEREQPSLLPHEVLLVVGVVSKSNPENDYEGKVRDYAAMGIPLHLLVDPRKGTGIVHDEPGYASRTHFVVGDTVPVGPWRVDTSGLLTYA
ncbi:Uma2 family endonuclease [Kitasatospora sp. DSM 101779]|uniref:Uma2 family endonuclease n=1 Tax=Kitasatospora sp. DSM 101779 TaxID=2853165 RepID=UPI0021D8AB63|nr:Uma2 family endonuclease [Kitasatospora sp. DSM 101779]MCU7824415.1 Uma2 family endonuclease [Kitasatospora sp. DSM 101779]